MNTDTLKQQRDGHLFHGPKREDAGLRPVGEVESTDERGHTFVRVGEGTVEYAPKDCGCRGCRPC